MARGIQKHNSSRQVIHMPVIDEDDFTTDVTITIPRFGWRVARAFLSCQAQEVATYDMLTHTTYYETPDAEEFDQIQASIDQTLAAEPTEETGGEMPIPGEIRMFGKIFLPDGWYLCDGSAYSPTEYPVLYSAIGYTYGNDAGDFLVPDLQDRFPFGASYDHQPGEIGGEETHVLTTAEMPSHRHRTIVHDGTGAQPYFRSGTSVGYGMYSYVDYEGGGEEHNNMPPYTAILFGIYGDLPED